MIVAYLARGEFEVDNSDAVRGFEEQVGLGGESEGFVFQPNAEATLSVFEAVGLETAAHFEALDEILGGNGFAHLEGSFADGGHDAVIVDNALAVDPLLEVGDWEKIHKC